MKRLILLIAAFALAFAAVSCIKYDDTEIKNELSELQGRVGTLEEQMKTANDNISGLWEIVNNLKKHVYVESVSESDGVWTIKFSNGKTATLSNGHTPAIGVKTDEDGEYYWTIDGDWLLDAEGNKIPVHDKAPQLEIEDGNWIISTDGGKTWTVLGKVNGTVADAFKEVTWDDYRVYITLGDGTQLSIPRFDLAHIMQRIQSIQYVPDYDDLKITVNSAFVSYGSKAMIFDQPTTVTYQILPAQYASIVAEYIMALPMGAFEGPDMRWYVKTFGDKDWILAWFDVIPVNTRAGGDASEQPCGMSIVDVESFDDETGEITFKVLPVNIASESFAASGLKPIDGVYMSAESYDPYNKYFSYGIHYDSDFFDYGATWYNSVKSSEWVHYVYNVDELRAYQNRTAFAVQLRLYNLQDYELQGIDDGSLSWTDYENELASPYTTLYPNVMDPIELLPDLYVPGPDGNLVKAGTDEVQYLHYKEFRKDGTEAEPGYRTIMDGVTPALKIDGKTVSPDEAFELGYFVPGIDLASQEVIHHGKTEGAVILGEKSKHITVEMDPEASESVRQAAVGGSVEGRYTFQTPLVDLSCRGFVNIIGTAVGDHGIGTVGNPYTVGQAIDLVKDLTWTSNTEYESTDEVFVKGKISRIASGGTYTEGGTYGNASFYISEDGSEKNEFYCFRILYLGNKKYTSGTDIKVGDNVVICGKLMNYKNNTPETVSNKAYLFSLN